MALLNQSLLIRCSIRVLITQYCSFSLSLLILSFLINIIYAVLIPIKINNNCYIFFSLINMILNPQHMRRKITTVYILLYVCIWYGGIMTHWNVLHWSNLLMEVEFKIFTRIEVAAKKSLPAIHAGRDSEGVLLQPNSFSNGIGPCVNYLTHSISSLLVNIIINFAWMTAQNSNR